MKRTRNLTWDADLQQYVGVTHRTGQPFTVSAEAVAAVYAKEWCRALTEPDWNPGPLYIDNLARTKALRCSTYSKRIGQGAVQLLGETAPAVPARRMVRCGQVLVPLDVAPPGGEG